MSKFEGKAVRFGRWLGSAVIVAAASLISGGAVAQPVANAPAGEIHGISADGLELFQGIPYAKPPVGDLRWAPPEAEAPFALPFQATTPGNECVQLATFWRPGKPASWTEDCLSLSVYRPAGAENLPVMVGFHGGGFVNGAKTDWDPRELAREGNIVVTVNYRLGALAYLSMDELNAESADGKSSGNYGNLDKVQALRWIQQNITTFGGDPNRVTVGGQSAGARGICFLLASPEAKGLFHGAIVESGGNCAATSMEASLTNGSKFVEAIGCDGAADKLACLREKTPGEVLAAQAASGIRGGVVFGGAEMPKDALDAFQSGEFNRVPVIVGNTLTETLVFTYEAYDLQGQPVIAAEYEDAIKSRMGDKADEVFAAYADVAARSPGLALGNFNADRGYACSTPSVIDALAKWTPTYSYVFADTTAPLRSYAAVPPSFELGAPHSAELPYLWGENTVPNGLTPDQQKLAKMMRSYLVALTDPDGMAASGQPEWPAYTPDSQQRLVLKPGGKNEIISQSDYLAPHHCELFN